MVLCQQLVEAQEHYQGPADQHHSPALDFKVGQQVFIRAEFICMTRPSEKLAENILDLLTSTSRSLNQQF
jgi:hypothetical protein